MQKAKWCRGEISAHIRCPCANYAIWELGENQHAFCLHTQRIEPTGSQLPLLILTGTSSISALGLTHSTPSAQPHVPAQSVPLVWGGHCQHYTAGEHGGRRWLQQSLWGHTRFCMLPPRCWGQAPSLAFCTSLSGGPGRFPHLMFTLCKAVLKLLVV